MPKELLDQLVVAGMPMKECPPSLEELIGACAGLHGFECLTKEPTGEKVKRVLPMGDNPYYGKPEETIYKWRATAYQFKSGTWFEGSTPTEAVANLWLALNPKPL